MVGLGAFIAVAQVQKKKKDSVFQSVPKKQQGTDPSPGVRRAPQLHRFPLPHLLQDTSQRSLGGEAPLTNPQALVSQQKVGDRLGSVGP